VTAAQTPAWALEMLADARVGRLATADAGGQPLVVPVCYVYDGARCYSAVDGKPKRTRDLKRLRNLADNPRVSLAVDHYDEDWRALRYVIVQGRGDVLESGPDFSHAIDLLVAKYPQYRNLHLDRTAGAVVRVTPERILSWRFS
jgi:PPOX class probable F420-dependent enzyme